MTASTRDKDPVEDGVSWYTFAMQDQVGEYEGIPEGWAGAIESDNFGAFVNVGALNSKAYTQLTK